MPASPTNASSSRGPGIRLRSLRRRLKILARPRFLSTIEIVPPVSFSALDAALACLGTYVWLLFTSANAVEIFHRRAQFNHVTHFQKDCCHWACHLALPMPLVLLSIWRLLQYIAESLAAALVPDAFGDSFLLVRAAEARDLLPETLAAAGAHVTIAEAYRNQIPADSIRRYGALC